MFHSYLLKLLSLNRDAPSVGVLIYSSAARMCLIIIVQTFSIIWSLFNFRSSFSLILISLYRCTSFSSFCLLILAWSIFFYFSISLLVRLLTFFDCVFCNCFFWYCFILFSKNPLFLVLVRPNCSRPSLPIPLLLAITWELGAGAALLCSCLIVSYSSRFLG